MSERKKGTSDSPAPKESKLYCTFRLSERLFGIDILDVKEVTLPAETMPIPHTPDAVRGYVNLRGQIFLVLDAHPLLGLDPIELTDRTRMILFKPSVGDSFGILVDSIEDVATVRPEQIEDRRRKDRNSPDGSERRQMGNSLVAGVCKLPGELLIVMDARGLLPALEQQLSELTLERTT